MFKVEGKKITITKGDTAALTIRATNRTFASVDRALFTITNKAGTDVLFREAYPLTDGAFTVEFRNDQTDDFSPGSYKWQVRYVINPTRDDNTNDIISGAEVITPDEPQDFVVQNVLWDF